MPDRAYLSIGEVLNLLRTDFADLTISKIRFLESQGLLEPERTPSGYRKFYEPDVERLRWILRQQREQYLPLKVIKGRLGMEIEADADAEAHDGESVGSPDLASPAGDRAPDDGASGAEAGDDGDAITTAAVTAATGTPGAPEGTTDDAAPAGTGGATSSASAGSGRAPATARASAIAAAAAAAAAAATSVRSPVADSVNPLKVVHTGVSMSLDELAAACALSKEQLHELESYGMLGGRAVGGTTYYDEEALIVANLAAAFMRYGVEPRHLRMYRTSAEREAGFFEQLVMPMLKQRNPRTRRQALETLAELGKLGQGLRAAMLRAALREHTEP